MYLFETGLGQTSRPRPKAPANRPPQGPAKQFKLVDLKVTLRRSFKDFLHEVENACETWMARPTARRLIKKSQVTLHRMHQEMLNNKQIKVNDPILVYTHIEYRRSNGIWLVNDMFFLSWRLSLLDL